MKNNLHYAPEALQDLDDIWEYIFSDLSNPNAAMKIVDRIMSAIDQLKDFAGIGTPLRSVVEVESEYRFLVVGNYLIFYRVIGPDIYIDRILYGRRDYMRILFGDDFKDL